MIKFMPKGIFDQKVLEICCFHTHFELSPFLYDNLTDKRHLDAWNAGKKGGRNFRERGLAATLYVLNVPQV